MATILGRNAVIRVSDDGGTTYESIGKVLSVSQSSTINKADETTNDSNGFIQEKYADQQISWDVTVKYDSSNAGQLIVIVEQFVARAGINAQFWPLTDTSTPEKEWEAAVLISDVTIDTSTAEVEEMSFTMTSNGTITYGNQTP